MRLSNSGRTYEPGKALTVDLRRAIVDEVVKRGGNMATGYFPGAIANVAEKFCISRSTVRRIWQRFCNEFTEQPWNSGKCLKLIRVRFH